MLNLDSEEDGRLTTGCAGSTDTFLRLELPREAAAAGEVALSASPPAAAPAATRATEHRPGTRQRDQGARRVACARRWPRCRSDSASLDGGKSRNAIPRDASAVVLVAEGRADALRAALQKAAAVVSDAYALTDPGVDLTVEAAERPVDAWSADGDAHDCSTRSRRCRAACSR